MAADVWRCPTSVGDVVVRQTTRVDGDFHLQRVGADELDARRRRVLDAPWTMLEEVHGTAVVTVDRPGAGDGEPGDVLVTDVPDAALGVWTGDCAAVVVVAPDGRFGAAHGGWRGLAHGVLNVLVDAVDPADRGGLRGVIGPVIGPCCYEFGAAELELVASALDVEPAAVSGRTSWGAPSLDMAAAVSTALGRRGVRIERLAACTRCDDRYFSHRRGDTGRHVTAAWRRAPEPTR